MAKERIYKVVIDGEEYVSAAAKEAGDGMDGFANKQPRWIKSFADLKLAWDAISAAIGKVWGAIQGSFDAFDAYENSLRKMEAQSKITGVPLSELNEMAEKGRKEFGLGRVVANDYATVVGIYASVAGNAALKSELFANALELGAANGLDAAQTMTALEQGLRGQDEGFDLLLKRNPSTIWKEYADANGLAVGKMTDTQKRLAEVTALIDAGRIVTGNYATMLTTASGQQALLNNRLEDARIAVGGALAPLRIFAIELLGDVTERGSAATGSINGLAQSFAAIGRSLQPIVGPLMWLADFMLTGLATAFRFAQIDITRAVLKMEERIYNFIGGIGTAVTKAGDLLNVFGVKVVRESGEKITAWAKEMNEVTGNELLHLGVKMQDFRADMAVAGERLFGHLSGIAKDNMGQVGAAIDGANQRLRVDTPDAAIKAGKAIEANLGPTVQDLLGVTEQSMRDLAKTATMTLEPSKAQAFNGELGHLVTRANEVRDRLMGWTPQVERTTGAGKDLSREVGTLARAALDLSGAFGVVDDSAARVLNSVVNIAAALPRALAGDLTSMAGILGGVASIAKQIIGGDAERKKLMRDNTRGLDRLTKEVGNLRLGVTGDQFRGVQDAIGSVIGQLGGGRGARNQADIVGALRQRGLSMADLEEVAKELGIKIKMDSGAISVDGIRQLFEAMGMTEFGQFGTGFSDRLDSTTRGFDIRGTSDGQQIADLFGLGAEFAPALRGIFDANDLAGTRGRLGELFQGLVDGTIAPAGFGGLTGTEFLDLITDLIGRIDGVMGSGTGNAPVSDGEEVPSEPVVTEEQARQAERQRQMDEQRLRILQAEEVIANLRRDGVTPAEQARIDSMRAIIDDANERIADMRRRFEIEDTERRLGTLSPTANAPTTTAPTGTGTAPSPTLTLADVFRDYATESLPLFTQQIDLQTRIAAATEATADNTAATVEVLLRVASAIERGALSEATDQAIERERYALAVEQGQRGTF